MKIRIKQDARKIYLANGREGYSSSWCNILDKIAGKTLEVDTEFLFKDQFSTFPIKEVSELGLRIRDELVEEIIDDIRPIRQRCSWCGKHSSIRLETCPHCTSRGYLESLGEASNAEKYIIEINYPDLP